MATKSDPLSAFRNELCARRERKGLNYNEAARLVRPKFSGQRWRELEQQTDTRPRRATIIKLARALGWDPAHALTLAGEPSLAPVESLAVPENPRDQLIRLLPALSDRTVRALVDLGESIVDPATPVPTTDPATEEQTGPGPAKLHQHVIETPGEPVRSVDGQEGLIEPS